MQPAQVAAMRAALEDEQIGWGFAAPTGDTADLVKQVNRLKSPAKLVRWAAHPNKEVRLAAVTRSTCPPEMLAVLADDSEVHIREKVRSHPNCPPEILDRLVFGDADHAPGDVYDWQEVANHRNATPEALTRIAAAGPEWLVRRVARNPNCPPELLHHWLTDAPIDGSRSSRERDLIIAAASNPNADPDDLVDLLRDGSEKVQHAASVNPACPVNAVEHRYKDEPYPFCWHLLDRDDLSSSLLHRIAVDTGDPDHLHKIAAHPNASADTLDLLSTRGNVTVRVAVAENPNTSMATLQRMSVAAQDAAAVTATAKIAASL